ncbi:MAG: ABC transporter permease [Terracidiphilus sp.]
MQSTGLQEDAISRVARKPWVEIAAQDMQFAIRQVRKAPGFALATVLTLALGIGTATAMFAIIYGVLLRPLPFQHAGELYQPIETNDKGGEESQLSNGEIEQWRDATRGNAEIAYTQGGVGILDAPTGALLVSPVSVSANLLRLLGAQPAMGRAFLPEEFEDGRSHEVLLSDAVWRQDFFAARDVLGKVVHIAGISYTVIGVMPPEFEYPLNDRRAQVWMPSEPSKLLAPSGPAFYARSLEPILRIEDRAKAAAVQAQLSAVQERIARSAKPDDEIGTRVRLMELRDFTVSGARPALLALEIAVALVWLIACCNVAGLLLARIAARRTEIAVRGALGAGRMRIVSQFLTESLFLSASGAACGLGLAALILESFRRMLGKMLPLAEHIELSWPVGAALAGLTLLTGFAFGLFPAIAAARTPMEAGLKSGGRTAGASRDQNRLRGVLLMSEIALSLVLLVGASLMMRTIYALRHVSLGFRTDHILMTDLTVPSADLKGRNLNADAWDPLLERIRRLPGVEAAALSTVMPISHPVEWLTVVYATPWTHEDVSTVVRAATPDLMKVLGVRMRAGRFFTTTDRPDSTPVIVVNQTFVNRYLGGRDALGRQIRFGRVPQAGMIVGVVEDVHQDEVGSPSQPELYLCAGQLTPDSALYPAMIGRYMQLAVRAESAPGAMVTALRRAIQETTPSLAVGSFTTMDEAVEDSIGGQRLAAGVIGTFGGLALMITVVGLYGLLSYSVEQRTQEIGIRMALGADRGSVVAMVMRQAFLLVIAGAAAGLALALWSSRLLHSFLFGVQQYDPWTLALAPGVPIVFGVVAAFIPARRAASIDPIRALRTE